MFATHQEAFEFLYNRWGLPAVQVMISAVKAYGADTGAVQVLTIMPVDEMSFTHQDEKALVGGMHYIEDNLPQWQETRVLRLPDGQTLTLDAALVAEE